VVVLPGYIYIYIYTLKVGVPSAQAEAELHLLGPKNRSGKDFFEGMVVDDRPQSFTYKLGPDPMVIGPL